MKFFLALAMLASVAGCQGALADRRHRVLDAGAVPIDPSELDDGGTPDPIDASSPSDGDASIRILGQDGGPLPPIPPTDCTYPSGASGSVSMGEVIRAYRWATAYREDGTRVAFDLASFHCDATWSAYSAVLFVVGTGWCPNCPDYLRAVAGLSLASHGTLVVFLESQNASYATASSADARSTVDRAVGRAPGLRIGEAENAEPDAIGGQISAVPSGIFVRRRDMVILANEYELGVTPPWDEMAAAPDMDWVSRLRGGGSGATCTEETLEPNDTRASAAAITPGAFSGGICGANDDFFRVSVPGAWRVDLGVRIADGDLDLYVLDAAGRAVVTSDSADDDESVSFTGPATVRVVGYGGARAPYTLTLVSL